MPATAKKTLNRAFSELDQAQGDLEKKRQAAEKGWRAAREAVYEVMRCHGATLRKGTINVGDVGDFEAKALKRPRDSSQGQPLADGYARAMESLHGSCFYESTCPTNLKGELQRVGVLIEQAERDIGRCKRRK